MIPKEVKVALLPRCLSSLYCASDSPMYVSARVRVCVRACVCVCVCVCVRVCLPRGITCVSGALACHGDGRLLLTVHGFLEQC